MWVDWNYFAMRVGACEAEVELVEDGFGTEYDVYIVKGK